MKNNSLILRISTVRCSQYIWRSRFVVVITMGSRIRLIQDAILTSSLTGKFICLKDQFSTHKIEITLKEYSTYVYSINKKCAQLTAKGKKYIT